MRPGEASGTAQRVAAQRLTFPREPAPNGDPAADDALAADVAGSLARRVVESPMRNYLLARTAFFDRAVVAAVGAGVGQVVVAAAGYDGRAWRCAAPGVRWFELDHPDTQADKLARLGRLGIDTSAVTFVAADFAVDDVGAALGAAGLDASAGVRTLVLCEGVAVYLDRPVLEALLAGLRSAVAGGSRMAISLSASNPSPAQRVRRAAFAAGVASLGEPARTYLDDQEAAALLARTRWGFVGTERGRQAGLLLLEAGA